MKRITRTTGSSQMSALVVSCQYSWDVNYQEGQTQWVIHRTQRDPNPGSAGLGISKQSLNVVEATSINLNCSADARKGGETPQSLVPKPLEVKSTVCGAVKHM